MKDLFATVLPLMKATRSLSFPSWGVAEILAQKDQSPHNVVTHIDREIERVLAAALAQAYPDIAFIGEEFGGDRTAQRYWLADPIDGTLQYIRGLPSCTTMLALVEEGQVVFGAIYDFVRDEIYYAKRGGGSYKNGDRISVSCRPFTHAMLAVETRIEKQENLAVLMQLYQKVLPLRMIVAGYEYALVAAGRIEGRICFDPYGCDYDYAPGSLLVSEAGGVVANLGTDTYDLRNNNFIACNRSLYEALTHGALALFPQSGGHYQHVLG